MKRDSVNYLAVGCFVLAMGVALLYGLYRITGQSGKGDAYVTHFANVAGIKVGSQVTYEGYAVGNVAAIEPVAHEGRTRFRVALVLKQPQRIPVDSAALITAPGLLAAPLIEIREGASREVLATGGEIRGVAGSNLVESVAALTAQLGEIAASDLKPLLAQIGRRVDTLGGSLEKNLPPAMDDLRSTLARLNATAGRVEQLFSDENRQRWQRMLGNADEASTDVLKLSRELHGVSREVGDLVRDSRGIINGTGRELESSLKRADSVLYQLESAGRHLNEFSRQVRENPSALINSRPPAEAQGDEK